MSRPLQSLGSVRSRKFGNVSILDPLADDRWEELVSRHPNSSIFHSIEWLRTLQMTYGYTPLVLTTSKNDQALSNGIVLCEVRSWATGSRLVSLPFSDYSDPLLNDPFELEVLLRALSELTQRGRFRYVEIRPLHVFGFPKTHFQEEDAHYVHRLDLSPDLDELYQRFHKSCVRRKIRKAERFGLHYEEGRSEELLAKFYKLLLRTRRRQQVPPQSIEWFRNLASCLGERLKIRVVSSGGQPVASIITCHFRDTVVYKYGCSDADFHNLGGPILLIWQAIQDAKSVGANWFDFGRSHKKNKGLINFKDHWGGERSSLPYYRFSVGNVADRLSPWKRWLIRRTCAYMPDPLLGTLGTVLYRHAG